MKSYVERLQQGLALDGESWCLQFIAPMDGYSARLVLLGIEQSAAQWFLKLWHENQETLRVATFCTMCPTGETLCIHSDTPLQRGWRYQDIRDPRIMPEREVIL